MMWKLIAYLNLVYLRPTVPEILDRKFWEIVYKMAANERTKVASDVKYDVWASFI